MIGIDDYDHEGSDGSLRDLFGAVGGHHDRPSRPDAAPGLRDRRHRRSARRAGHARGDREHLVRSPHRAREGRGPCLDLVLGDTVRERRTRAASPGLSPRTSTPPGSPTTAATGRPVPSTCPMTRCTPWSGRSRSGGCRSTVVSDCCLLGRLDPGTPLAQRAFRGVVAQGGSRGRGSAACGRGRCPSSRTGTRGARSRCGRFTSLPARSDEAAEEHSVDAGDEGWRTYGATTLFLVEELEKARPGVSWQRVVAKAAARVAGRVSPAERARRRRDHARGPLRRVRAALARVRRAAVPTSPDRRRGRVSALPARGFAGCASRISPEKSWASSWSRTSPAPPVARAGVKDAREGVEDFQRARAIEVGPTRRRDADVHSGAGGGRGEGARRATRCDARGGAAWGRRGRRPVRPARFPRGRLAGAVVRRRTTGCSVERWRRRRCASGFAKRQRHRALLLLASQSGVGGVSLELVVPDAKTLDQTRRRYGAVEAVECPEQAPDAALVGAVRVQLGESEDDPPRCLAPGPTRSRALGRPRVLPHRPVRQREPERQRAVPGPRRARCPHPSGNAADALPAVRGLRRGPAPNDRSATAISPSSPRSAPTSLPSSARVRSSGGRTRCPGIVRQALGEKRRSASPNEGFGIGSLDLLVTRR